MHIILFIMATLFIFFALFGFYYSSEKNYKKTITTRYAFIAKHPFITKITSCLLLFFAWLLLTYLFNFPIAFVFLWIVMTPISFFIILLKNELNLTHKH